MEPKLYQLYWPYECKHCGHKGLVRERDWRCKNYDCRKPVIPYEYETLEEQDARRPPRRTTLTMITTKACPMCHVGIDEDGNEVKPVRSRHRCEFCGSTGRLQVLDEEILEDYQKPKNINVNKSR